MPQGHIVMEVVGTVAFALAWWVLLGVLLAISDWWHGEDEEGGW